MSTDSADRPDPAEPFDQTNRLADGLDGESDGTQEGDTRSAADRDDESEGPEPAILGRLLDDD